LERSRKSKPILNAAKLKNQNEAVLTGRLALGNGGCDQRWALQIEAVRGRKTQSIHNQ
jgi:hypothetical protein